MENWVRGALELERVPYTQNTHYLQETKAKYLALYKDARSGKLELPQAEWKSTGSGPEGGEDDCMYCFTVHLLIFIIYLVTVEVDFEPPSATTTSPFNFAASKPATDSQFKFGQPTSMAISPKRPAAPASLAGAPARKKNKRGHNPYKTTSSNGSGAFGAMPTSANEAPEPSSPKFSATVSEPPEDTLDEAADRTAVTSRKRALDSDERRELEDKALAALASLGYHVTPADLGKLNPPDVYEAELELMAEVRAYFQIAYKVCLSLRPPRAKVQSLIAAVAL